MVGTALRRHRPRRVGGNCAVPRPTTKVAPLDAARTAQHADPTLHHGCFVDNQITVHSIQRSLEPHRNGGIFADVAKRQAAHNRHA
jgi:hypothetical protein